MCNATSLSGKRNVIGFENGINDGRLLVELVLEYVNDISILLLLPYDEVGFSGIFTRGSTNGCANCERQSEEDVIHEDAVPVTQSLVYYLSWNLDTGPNNPEMSMRTLQSFEPEHVIPFLKEHLDWRVTDTASNLKNEPQELIRSGLEVAVSDRMYNLPSEEYQLGIYYPSLTHREITKDKIGGYGYVAA